MEAVLKRRPAQNRRNPGGIPFGLPAELKKKLTKVLRLSNIKIMDKYICIFLGALLIIREYQNWKDRKDLMDRIMCKDWPQFKKHTEARIAHRGLPGRMTDEEMFHAEKERNK